MIRRRIFALAVGGSLLVGCGSDSSTPPAGSSQEQFCNRWQTCGYFQQGQTVQTCVSGIEQCLAVLTSEQAASWRDSMGKCLAISDCNAFRTCYHDIHGC